MTALLFAAAVLGIPLAFGAPILRLRSLRELSLPARTALAWVAGTLVLAVLLTLMAAVGLRWAPWPVLVLAVVPVLGALRMQAPSQSFASAQPELRRWESFAAGLGAAVIAGAGLMQFSAGAATSADLAYFWGVKAVHFALDRGMGFEWMQLPHLAHLHPNYPPLWPVSLAWGALVSGSMPWALAPMLTWIYLAAAGLFVHSLLRSAIGRRAATAVACLWFAVVTGSMVQSFSGGSAEGPLLLFVTVAVTTLVVERRDEEPTLRWLAAGALAGAVLTKNEGAVAATLVVAGTAVRDWTWGRSTTREAAARRARQSHRLAVPALAAGGLWAAIRFAHGVPLADPIRESALHLSFDHIDVIFKVCVRLLLSGVSWIGWLVPLVALAAARPRQPLRVLPGLLVAGGLPVFAVFYYLHAVHDPLELIVWTFPRLIQPALSAWIVCLGVLCFGDPSAPTPNPSPGVTSHTAPSRSRTI